MASSLCVLISISLWLLVNVADAWWIYYYVQATVNPIPHTAVNRTSSGFTGYTVMMFFFGFVWGIVNMLVTGAYLSQAFKVPAKSFAGGLFFIFNLLVSIPLFLLFTIMPFFGGWIVVPIVQRQAWNHQCDNYPMFAILDAKSYNDPRYVVNVAYFFDNSAPASPTQLFTYEITNPDDGDDWLFSLRTWDILQSKIPLDMYPTLQSVHYDFVDDSLSGNCTLPNSNNSLTNTTTIPCMEGNFDPGNHLSFNITSSVPLNTTLPSDAGSIPTVNTLLGIPDNGWALNGYAPALRLQERNADDSLGHLVLKTTVTKPHDVTELKVCVAGVDGREGGTVAAEVLAPLGLMLMRQADYALLTTTPSNDD